jgi:LysR family glycine cleavage system transcriptional activator
MSTHLPSTTALAAFNQLFLTRSINKAAGVLHMTPPAVSYQISTLEAVLGHRLFVRSAKGMEPTPFAESIYFDVTAALEHMLHIVRRSREQQLATPVRILATQALASLWLLPKMPALLECFKGVHFEIISWVGGVGHSDSGRDAAGFDFEFRYARLDDLVRREDARMIAADRAILVCSPEYLQRLSDPRRVEAFESATVLHARNWPGIWDRWCQAAFGRSVVPENELHFQGTSLCVQAALVGIGIAIVHAPLVADELHSGRLVRPHAFGLDVEEAYFAVLGRPLDRHAELFDGFVAWCRENMYLEPPAMP